MDHWACNSNLADTIVSTYAGFGPTFAGALQLLLAAQCSLLTNTQYPPDRTDQVKENPEFDFIVVGAGSAGSVVANRLSENPNWNVLLLEAGGDPDFLTEAPANFFNVFNATTDWGYVTEPGDNYCLSLKNQQSYWTRGKVLGGCSSVNAMYYVRGNRKDFDEWAEVTNIGWSYKYVLPFFKKSQHYSKSDWNDELEMCHQRGGYLHTELKDNEHPIETMLIEMISSLGHKFLKDTNCFDQLGVTRTLMTVKEGRRMSTARAFLTPAKDRKNLYLVKKALATKILIEGHNVKGAQFSKDGQLSNVYAKKEVVISAGTINSPQLLLLSGIGPKDHLQKIGVDIVKDLPVGDNLKDHIFVPIFYKMKGETSSFTELAKDVFEYIFNQKGSFSDLAPARITVFLNSKNDSEVPDIQILHSVIPPEMTTNHSAILEIFNLKTEIKDQIKEINKKNSLFTVFSLLLRPKSSGKITLKSKNPFQYPSIKANYLKEEEDLDLIVYGMKEILKYKETEQFKKLDISLVDLDIPECNIYVQYSDEYLKCYARHLTLTLYHPACTVAMGEDGVVDARLRVHGMKGLRVADASVMPDIVRGNINAAVVMIGEKAADMIAQDWTLHEEL